jgi:hypothetical protein
VGCFWFCVCLCLGAALGGAIFDFGFAALLLPTLLVGCLGLAVGLLALERRMSAAENGVVSPSAD